MTQIGIKMYDMNDIMIRNMAEEKIIISDYGNSNDLVNQEKIISKLEDYMNKKILKCFILEQ